VKARGLVRKIGVSIYDPCELDRLCASFAFDLVQAPFNLLDRRLIASGWLARLADQGTELHVRSIFLQGLLLMPRERRPPAFARWDALWRVFHTWLDEAGVTPLQACLRDALSHDGISRVVVGVDSRTQLTEILDAAGGEAPPVPDALETADTDLLNPAQWPALV
jgi:aryl-alcohol dehydrogenase-like predicted oxidoreductase